MNPSPIICFGQQPCGFFPKRFLVAKIRTARRLQAEIGGTIVYFCHDSDHDPRETRTLLRHRKTEQAAQLNFSFENRIQRKFSPLNLKRIPSDWHEKTLLQLSNYVEHDVIEIFRQTSATNAADFCLEMYRRLGWLAGLQVVRSSDPAVRHAACEVADFFVDVPYEGEVVRARPHEESLVLHEGGDAYIALPKVAFGKEQVSPSRDTRLRWMQSVVHCTHYVAGPGERAYLHPDEAPEITFIDRETIDRSDEAYTEIAS